MNEKPRYASPHYLLRGTVAVRGTDNIEFDVNWDTGTCTCKDGDPHIWAGTKEQRWVLRRFCQHKILGIASACEAAKAASDKAELQRLYWKKLSERYNVWEAVSAFHKELRRRDVDKAKYWAMILAGHRGLKGVINYFLNIMFEETRDIPLYVYVLGLAERGDQITLAEMLNATERFALAPKKWELKWRLPIFITEMQAYKALAVEYGYKTVSGNPAIEVKGATRKLSKEILDGFAAGDRVQIQRGVKGLYKTRAIDEHTHKLEIFNLYTDILNEDQPNKLRYNRLYAERLQRLHMRRIASFGRIGYHELNAFADALAGESPDDSATLPATLHSALIKRSHPSLPPMGVFYKIPLYAQDNHTYRGKAAMSKYGEVELLPGANQEHMDFRMCGAYMGVAWRHLAFNQFGTTDVPWGDVKWNKPSWLWKHLDSMWY